jgi:large subunit ribosomal protein L4
VARKSALTYRAKANEIIIIEDIKLDTPKTKSFLDIFKNIGAADKAVYVSSDIDSNLFLSSKNVQSTKITEVSKLNTYDILNCKKLVFSESSLEYFKK